MNDDIFSLTPLNLALDGSLDLFLDLYQFTYDLYLNLIRETPSLINQKETLDKLAIPQILPAFELLAFRRLRIFTTKIKNIHLQPHHFKRFSFFSESKIRTFEHRRQFNLEWVNRGFKTIEERFFNEEKEIFEFQESVIDLEDFLLRFKFIVVRAIHEEIHKQNPEYTILAARGAVDAHIEKRMRWRRKECVVPKDKNIPATGAPLYLFDALNKTACKLNQHRIISKIYYATHIDGKHTVALPAHYCETCDRYMIGALSLSLFKGHCGKFIAQVHHLVSGSTNEWSMLGESKLHQLGYNVLEGNLSSSERQNILVSIMEGKQLSFFEIVSTIEQNIRNFRHNHRMQKAVEKWYSDLQFINDYVLAKSDKLT